MAAGSTMVKRKKEPKHGRAYATSDEGEYPGHVEKTYGPGEYPEGSVPRETGFYATEASNLNLPGHNRITVCRGRK